MINQRTIAHPVSVTGIGIHSGKKVSLSLLPALANTGIQFKRVDLPHQPVLKATATTVGTTENATTLGEGIEAIHTVEHLLSVLYGFGIDNIMCEINGPEVPIMDGSGASFVFLIKETGVRRLAQNKKFMVILKPVEVRHEGKWAKIEPHPQLVIESTIVFPHPIINKQKRSFEFNCENYLKEISRARTFGLLRDVDMLKRKGLIRGGSLNNAIVLDDFKVVNPEGLRFEDEFIRHKILDTIGDMSLLGCELAGKITTYKSGHHMHNLLCRAILEDPSSYKIVSAQTLQEAEERLYIPQTVTVTA